MKSVCGLDVHHGLVEMKKAATSLMAWVAALQMNAVPACGLIITHIDYDEQIWDNNNVSFRINIDVSGITLPNAVSERECKRIYSIDGMQIPNGYSQNVIINVGKYRKSTVRKM